MTDPTYREITAADLAVYEDADMLVRVICGEFMGKQGPVKGTFVDPFYFDVTIHPGGAFARDIPAEETVFLLLLSGRLHFEDGKHYDPTGARGILLTAGEQIHITSAEGARFLLMAGKPLHEPVAWGGPIVMNTREELRRAFREIDEGTFIKKK